MVKSKQKETDFYGSLAKQLADNYKDIRDRGIVRFRKFILTKINKDGITDKEFMKIWKGLHYCMWMSDKQIVQEELVGTIASFIQLFEKPEAALQYFHTYFSTECREWHGIDKWRLNKYMRLVRRMTAESFSYLREHAYDSTLMQSYHRGLLSTTINPCINGEYQSNELICHFSDIYVDELERINDKKLTPAVAARFFRPYVHFILITKSKSLLRHVEKSIFQRLFTNGLEHQRWQAAVKKGEAEKDDPEASKLLIVDYKMLLKYLLKHQKKVEKVAFPDTISDITEKLRRAVFEEFDVPSYEALIPYVNKPMPDEIDMREIIMDEIAKVDKQILEPYHKRKRDLEEQVEAAKRLKVSNDESDDSSEDEDETEGDEISVQQHLLQNGHAELNESESDDEDWESEEEDSDDQDSEEENSDFDDDDVLTDDDLEDDFEEDSSENESSEEEEIPILVKHKKPSVVAAINSKSKKTPKPESKTKEEKTPESAKSTPKSAKSTPKSAKSIPKSAKSTPKSAKSTPKSAKSTPKSTPKNNAEETVIVLKEKNKQDSFLNDSTNSVKKKNKRDSLLNMSLGIPGTTSTPKTGSKKIKNMIEFDSPSAKSTPGATMLRKAAHKNSMKQKNSPKSNANTPQNSSRRKSVSFIMDNNEEQDFEDSLIVSPNVPFKPSLTPTNSILKKKGMLNTTFTASTKNKKKKKNVNLNKTR